MNTYIIENHRVLRGEEEKLFWSNTHGWTDVDSADIFSEEEKNTLRLPLGESFENIRWLTVDKL